MDEIIAGVDGSTHSLQAVEWAAAEAARRDASLRVLYAIAPWLFHTSVDPRVVEVRDWLRKSGQEVIDGAVARVRERTPDVAVSPTWCPAVLPARWSRRPRTPPWSWSAATAGTLTGLLLGSVALEVASHAPCPAVIIRHLDPAAGREVVVGVDGSNSSQAAIGFAFEAAATRKTRLRAVHAWTHPASAGPGDMQPLAFDPDLVTAEEGRVLAESLAGWQERFPDVEVVRDVVRGRPTRVLAATSTGADLLVVGTRGRGGFAGLILGSVSHAMLHHARRAVSRRGATVTSRRSWYRYLSRGSRTR